MLRLILWLVFTVTVCAYWMTRRRKKRDSSCPPDLPGRLPIIGHAHMFIGDSLHAWKAIKWLSTETLKRGGVTSMSIGLSRGYCITDPADCLTVSNVCLQKAYYYEFAEPWLGKGLLTGSVPLWKLHRRLLGPAFSQKILDGFIGVFNSRARSLVDKLQCEVGRGPFDHAPYLALSNLETICQTAFGINMEEQSVTKEKYEKALHDIFTVITERFQKYWLHSNIVYNRTKLKKKQDSIVKELHDISDMILQKRKLILKNESEEKSDTFNTFLDVILQVSAGILSDKEKREEVDNIIFAGHDTISTVLTSVLLLLGSHPHVQDKLYNETQQVLDDGEDLCKSQYPRLQYLEAVIKEAMRVFPAAPVVARYTDAHVQLKNYTIPAGSNCYLLFWGVHRDPVWGDAAGLFRPDRWFDASLPDSNYFTGFSTGRRSCIGKVYAMMSMKTTLSFLIRNYRIKSDITNIEFKLEAMLRPVKGHLISIERRKTD